MYAVGLLREILAVAARPDFTIGVHARTDKVGQLFGLFSGCDAAVGEACGCRIHAGASYKLFPWRIAGLKQSRARAARAERSARTRRFRKIGIAEFDPDAF